MIKTGHFPGWEDLDAMLQHFRFVREHHNQIRRVALVTDGALRRRHSVLPGLLSTPRSAASSREDKQAEAWVAGAGGAGREKLNSFKRYALVSCKVITVEADNAILSREELKQMNEVNHEDFVLVNVLPQVPWKSTSAPRSMSRSMTTVLPGRLPTWLATSSARSWSIAPISTVTLHPRRRMRWRVRVRPGLRLRWWYRRLV